MMPSLFLSHGAPYLAIQDNEYTRRLQEIGKQLGRPRAIVIFSAHYETDVLHYTCPADEHGTIYDFYGFPEQLYTIKYPAKSSPETAELLAGLLKEAGIPAVVDRERGLDHGSWVLLAHMFPQADIPVVSLSINRSLSPEQQYQIGKAVERLRQEDILVIASGGTSHNLRMIEWNATKPADWTVAFDDWLLARLDAWDTAALFAYRTQAPYADRAVPVHGNEHFVPLFIAMGAGDEAKQTTLLHRSYDVGTLSLIALQFA